MRLFKMGVRREKIGKGDREWRKIKIEKMSLTERLEMGKNILWNIKELELIEKGIKEYSDTSNVKYNIQCNLEWWYELLYDYNEDKSLFL